MEHLIQLLGDGQFHSGEELGASLGVSRAAVWKKLKGLELLGLELDSVRGRGYRLSSRIELFDEKAVREELSPAVSEQTSINLKMITGSTNDDVRQMPEDLNWRVCMAEYQGQGRGRRGRTWESPFGSSLYFSMLWRLDGGLAALEGLSLAVGLAVLQTLESLGVQGLSLKWPNDILANGCKLSGVLLEINGDPTGDCEVVIGIGVNLLLGKEQREKVDQPVTDVYQLLNKSISKNKLAGCLIEQLATMLEVFREHGFSAFRDEWLRHDAFAGQQVILSAGREVITGTASGVSTSGAVLIKNELGLTPYAGGEISLRKL